MSEERRCVVRSNTVEDVVIIRLHPPQRAKALLKDAINYVSTVNIWFKVKTA